MTARVRSVIASATAAGQRFSVSGSMSTKTGIPPRSATAFAHDTKVNEGMITSSPGPIPASSIGHLQRGGAARDDEAGGRADLLVEPLRAAPRELAVAGQVAVRRGLRERRELEAGQVRPVEGDAVRRIDHVVACQIQEPSVDVKRAPSAA